MSLENDGIWFQNVNELYEYKKIRSVAISSIFQKFQASDSNEGKLISNIIMSFELFAGCALHTREDIAKIKEFSSIPQYHGLGINIRAHLNDDGAQFLCDALSECQRKHFFGEIKIDLRKLRSMSVVDTQNLFSKCAESISNFLINFKNLSGFYFSLKHIVTFPVDFELFLTPLKLQKDLKVISLTSCEPKKLIICGRYHL